MDSKNTKLDSSTILVIFPMNLDKARISKEVYGHHAISINSGIEKKMSFLEMRWSSEISHVKRDAWMGGRSLIVKNAT